MYIHEYQAKEILNGYGLPIGDYGVVESVADAEELCKGLGLHAAAVKAQIHAGGRGKVGAVCVALSRDDIISCVADMIGRRFVTPQTTARGAVARKILLSPVHNAVREYYVAVTIDRKRAAPLLVLSTEGGVDIEHISSANPDTVLRLPLPAEELPLHHMGWDGPIALMGERIIRALIAAFYDTDALLIEINPLILTHDGNFCVADAKMIIDDNALFRHLDLDTCYDPLQYTQPEQMARHHNINYCSSSGTIGCFVNGAGLAMATMDAITRCGGKVANFLDIGGKATVDRIVAGFNIIVHEPNIETICINIFGGIASCLPIAKGIQIATTSKIITIPLIIRFEGNMAQPARTILSTLPHTITIVDSLYELALYATVCGGRCPPHHLPKGLRPSEHPSVLFRRTAAAIACNDHNSDLSVSCKQ